MANPQTENGFTSIAHEILEQVARQRFNGIQRSIIDIVWRYTYGFQRKAHQLAAGFIAEAIEADLKGVKVEMQRLIEWKVLLVVKEGKGARPRTISFNKNYEEWIVGESSPPKIKNANGGQFSTMMVDDSPPLVGESSPPKIYKRKLRKKDINNNKGDEVEMAPKSKIAKSREGKREYAEEVWLKPEEHEKLLNEFGQDGVTWMLDVLSSYKLSVAKFYASDYAVFKRGGWLRNKYEEHLNKKNQPTYKNRSQQANDDITAMKNLMMGGAVIDHNSSTSSGSISQNQSVISEFRLPPGNR